MKCSIDRRLHSTLNKILLSSLICLFLQQQTVAQEPDSSRFHFEMPVDTAIHTESYPAISFHDYGRLLKDNFKRQVLWPFKTTAKDREILLGLSMVATVGLVTDWETNKRLGELRHTSSFVRVNSPVIGHMGASYSFVVLGATGLYGFVFKDERAKSTFLLATQAAITTGLWTHTIKFATSRTRPNEYNRWQGPGHLFKPYKKVNDDDEPFWKSEFNSFPSGHTSNAFAIATVFAKMYSDIPIVPILAYGTASLVGLSRMIENRHWGSDVLMGAALGYFCGSQVVNNYWRKFGKHTKHKKTGGDLSLNFNAAGGHNSFILNYNF